VATTQLTHSDLVASLQPEAGRQERIGLELEVGVVEPATGRAAAYDGERGVGRLLQTIGSLRGGEPLHDGSFLTEVTCPDGSTVSLEPGGALEFSSSPTTSAVDAARQVVEAFGEFSEIADRLGLALLPGGNLPFNAPYDTPLILKPRVVALCGYHDSLGEAGRGSRGVMTVSLASQTSLDFVSEQDMAEKLRLLTAAAVVVAAMCVNSPLELGRDTGVLSQRMCYLEVKDPRRCGPMPFAVSADFGFADFVDWIADLPMIYRRTPMGFRPAPLDRPFHRLVRDGFGDGSYPGFQDWRLHLSQVWPYARLRRTLETRLADGLPSVRFAGALPALWTGLCYDAEARSAGSNLFYGLTIADHTKAAADVARRGMQAVIGGRPVQELAAELLAIADRGLGRRVAADLESPDVFGLLDPLREVVDSGVTFAERLRRHWEGELQGRPDRYVAAYRI
jgi:glutamate--cysteine ligase